MELLKHPRVFALADKFQVESLKVLALDNFKNQLQQHWISDTFADCIREVYKDKYNGDRSMREAVIRVINDHASEVCHRATFREVVHDIGDFAVDVVTRLAGHQEYGYS